ncbi:MAG: alpha/beta fold hydrolase [Thiomonas sp.]|nr:alpha/beta fold hydrolase [Thiomonas sp.]
MSPAPSQRHATNPRSQPAATRDTLQPPPDSSLAPYDLIDRGLHALAARFSLGLSPAAMGLALADWGAHLAASPGKQASLAALALQLQRQWLRYAADVGASLLRADGAPCADCVTPPASDRRFAAPEWRQFPYNLLSQRFLLRQQWLDAATHGVRGVSPHHEQVVAFMARQWMDMLSPGNFLGTNPEVLARTLASGGANLAQGLRNWQDDVQRAIDKRPPAGVEQFRPGHEVAATPGKVVLRNALIELIQYTPTTRKVQAEPVLIVPAWIMKYYILDLSPSNSLVKYLVDQGHTVFMLSWKNPGPEDRDLGMDDYLRLGPLAALDAVRAIVPGQRIHAAGYCLGGTLLAIAAAALARRGDETLASISLFAAQTDFTEAGELTLFTDESQISFLEDLMWSQGYLDTTQMAGTFQMLRSSDLIWSRMMRDYLLGERAPMNDLMAWNADATRLPYRMHSDYLRKLYLRNALAEGHYPVDGHPVAVENVTAPWFVVGTETDHVAPWPSVYKIHLLADSEVTFVLTSGGHNAGIVSEPGHPNRHYRWAVHPGGRPYTDPAHWAQSAQAEDGSWWPRWSQWLIAKGSGKQIAPRAPGSVDDPALGPAPGEYVLQR